VRSHASAARSVRCRLRPSPADVISGRGTDRIRAGREVPLPVVGLAELVRDKRAAGRHSDLDDVEHLEPVLARMSRK